MTELSRKLVKKILVRLGIPSPLVPDPASLEKLYAAWCWHMPFENTRKMVALASDNNEALPGLDANDFFENWLEYGTGGTCWPVANAFYELLVALDFDAFRIAGHMRDLPELNHGSVKVLISDREYLAEASLLLNRILPLGDETLINRDRLYPAELERGDASHLLWLCTPPNEEYFFCRLMHDPVEYSLFKQRYEVSRETSVFNQRLYARRNYQDRMIILYGNMRYTKTVHGIEKSELTKEELSESLHHEIGVSWRQIKKWTSSGGLDRSFTKSASPSTSASELLPPSQRQTHETI